ncbi:MAG: hypothetical protein KJ060_12185, partial [Candidatus Hydrogenedentes bacterium]|nr:hypothetical protein [Candidatus Hydrogenedentota bacterium]
MAQDCMQKSRAGKPLSFMAGAALTVLASACGPAKAPEKPVEAVAPVAPVAPAAEVHLVPASPIDFSDRS